VSVFYRYSLLSLILIVAPVALGGSVTGAGEVSGADHGQGRDRGIVHDESADEMQKMNELRPDWQKIVGKTGSATVFRRWLAKQPKAYQRMIESATTAAELNESIEEFLDSSEAREAAHQEELEVKLAEMRTRAQDHGRHDDEEQRLR
jgi:hypothetical protein